MNNSQILTLCPYKADWGFTEAVVLRQKTFLLFLMLCKFLAPLGEARHSCKVTKRTKVANKDGYLDNLCPQSNGIFKILLLIRL